MKTAKTNKVVGIDGHARDRDLERELNVLFHRVFDTPEGGEVIAYLEDILFRRTINPSASDAELRMMEGSRAALNLIRARTESGGKTREEAR